MDLTFRTDNNFDTEYNTDSFNELLLTTGIKINDGLSKTTVRRLFVAYIMP